MLHGACTVCVGRVHGVYRGVECTTALQIRVANTDNAYKEGPCLTSCMPQDLKNCIVLVVLKNEIVALGPKAAGPDHYSTCPFVSV